MKIFYRIFKSTIILLTILLICGCTNIAHEAIIEKHRISTIEEAEGITVTNAVAMKTQSSDFVEIQFEKESSLLSEKSMSSLNTLIRIAIQESTIDKIIVLSWSDEEYPSKFLKRLPQKHKDLAARRNKSIEDYLKNLSIVSVDSYNMAERPSIISKLFQMKDSKIKNSLLAAGLPTTTDSARYAGKASHSVVLVKVK